MKKKQRKSTILHPKSLLEYLKEKQKGEEKEQSSCSQFTSSMSSRLEREPWIFTRATHTS